MALPVKPASVARVNADTSQLLPQDDLLVVEEPLELRLYHGPASNRQKTNLTVTMRTPGHDFELALGFLLGEGIISQPEDISQIRYCTEPVSPEEAENVILIHLSEDLPVPVLSLQRNFMSTAACGLCGKSSLETLRNAGCQVIRSTLQVTVEAIMGLSKQALQEQTLFKHTGGIHSAALFDAGGKLTCLREDIGRHNALDKLIGAMTQTEPAALPQGILFVSGRAGYELIQKALVAQIPIMAAVGAPSALAVELAERFGMTLIGFLKAGKFNLYSHPERITLPAT